MSLVQTDVVVAAHVQTCLMAADGLRGPYTDSHSAADWLAWIVRNGFTRFA